MLPPSRAILAAPLMTLALATGALAQAVTTVIPAERDATLYSNTAALSNGGGGNVFVGNNSLGETRRTALSFDVASAIPPGSLIVTVQLQLTVAATSDSTPRATAIHRLEAAWGEGSTVAPGQGGGGTAAQTGDATWTHRFFPTDPWASAGGELAAVPSAIATMPLSGVFTIGTTSGLIADVQAWVDGRRANHGWLIKATDESGFATARRIHSRETGFVGVDPILSIGFVPPGNVVNVGVGCIGSNGQEFRQDFAGQPVGGTQVTLGMSHGMPFGLGVTLIALGISPTPISVGPGCSVYLLFGAWPTLGWRVFDANGSSSDTYPIPADPNLLGSAWALQSLGFDPGIARGYVLSNAHLLVFR